MAKNTFNDAHLISIQGILTAPVVAKRSTEYTAAIVIGKPGEPGCLLISELDDDKLDYKWLVSSFPLHHPKEVADGEVPLVMSDEDRFETIGEMVSFVKGYFK